MFNSQYYTCEQIDQRLLQGYLDDYNNQNTLTLTKEQFLTTLYNFLTYGLRTEDIVQVPGNNTNKVMSQKIVTDELNHIYHLSKIEQDTLSFTNTEASDIHSTNLVKGNVITITVLSIVDGGVSVNRNEVYGKPVDSDEDWVWFGYIYVGIAKTIVLDRDYRYIRVGYGQVHDSIEFSYIIKPLLEVEIDLLKDHVNKLNTLISEGSLYVGILQPSSNPGTITGKVFGFIKEKGTYQYLLDSSHNPIVIPIEGLYIVNFNSENGYWTYDYLYKSEHVFDGGRADSVYGGARSIDCGGANS